MARWTIRDLRGHFAKKRNAGKLCPHKCCNGKREHPKDVPFLPSRVALRGLTDDQLAKSVDWSDPKSVARFMREAERRDRAEVAKERAKDKKLTEQTDRILARHAEYLRAEEATNGFMLSKAGKAAKIDPETLFTGPLARARKYGSWELNEWFDTYGRTNATEWRKQMRDQRSDYEEFDRRRKEDAERDRHPYAGVYPSR